MVSEVVDCQPSGTKFDMPLLLDLRVEETLDEDNDNGEDSGLENELAIEERNEYMSGLRDTYKVRCVADMVSVGVPIAHA